MPFAALESGAAVVEINPNPTPLTLNATYTIQGPSGVILPDLVKAAWGID